MLCELCNKNAANVHFKQVYNGVVKEIFVCEECAAEHGLDPQSPMSLTEFLFGAESEPRMSAESEMKTCPVCHMTGSDWKKTERLGCEACYATFAEEIAPMLRSMHRGEAHRGKVPARERAAAEVARLSRALREAVASQNFEEAARLRDCLKALTPDRSAKPAISKGN